jgi:hypothetical protein
VESTRAKHIVFAPGVNEVLANNEFPILTAMVEDGFYSSSKTQGSWDLTLSQDLET